MVDGGVGEDGQVGGELAPDPETRQNQLINCLVIFHIIIDCFLLLLCNGTKLETLDLCALRF